MKILKGVKMPDVKGEKAIDSQVGGNHYKKMKIQVVEFCNANNLDYFQGNIIKYICRWRDKNGLEDIRKCIHYAQLYLELEEAKLKDESTKS